MVRKHHKRNGCEFEQTPGDSEGQRSLACCSPWGCKESDTTQQLNNKSLPSQAHSRGWECLVSILEVHPDSCLQPWSGSCS